MKKLYLAIILIILSNPFHIYIRKTLDTYHLNASIKKYLEDNLGQLISVNTDQVLNKNDNKIEFTNNIKNTLFHKPYSSYTERTDSKGKKKQM